MKTNSKSLILALLLLAMATSALAVPHYPDMVVFRQPNSEVEVNIFLKGDERVHWAESEDGYALVHADDGSLVYAKRDALGDMVPSNYLAVNIKERSDEVNSFLSLTPKHLLFSQRQVDAMLSIWKQVEEAKTGPKTMSDVTGNKQFLVILFAFQDQRFTHSKSEFRTLFNQVNYTASSRTGSVHDYYYDVSHGLFSLNMDVVGPFVGVENTAYYGDSDNGYQAFAKEAVDSASKYVDFSRYDNDNDGHIDGLHIIFAGHGEEAGAPAANIWSHKWNIFNPPTYNGTVIDVYSCSPELSGNNGTFMTNIGVICHELGHVFGAPDYYDTDYAGSGGEYPGLGSWDIMSGGSWNRNGITPAHHNPYTKIYIYRWATCDTLDATPQVVTLDPVSRSNADFHRVNTSSPGDFFLLENRQKEKWDRHVPGSGMLVYHVHPNAHGANVNNSRHPQQISLLSPSGQDYYPTSLPSSYGAVSSSVTPLPGDSQRDSLTDFSMPWFRPWSQERNYTPFYHISENFTTLQVSFCIGNAEPEPMNVSAEPLSNTQVALNWDDYGNYSTLVLMNADGNHFGVPDTLYSLGDTLPGGGVVISNGRSRRMLLDSLEPGHTYWFRFFSRHHYMQYTPGITCSVTTLNCSSSQWTEEDFESTGEGSLPTCWVGDWNVSLTPDSNRVLSSPFHDSVVEALQWHSVTCAPFSFDTLHNAVLHFRLNMDDCTEGARFKVEYARDVNTDWTTLGEFDWRYGMPMWGDHYLQLVDAGALSRVRFSVYSDLQHPAHIDDISITQGNLVYAYADDHGSISPSGYLTIPEGDSLTVTMTPLPHYDFHKLYLDGASVLITDTVPRYTMAVKRAHTLYATFLYHVGIEEAERATLQLYPNPATDRTTVVATPGEPITVFNVMGQAVMKSANPTGTLVLDLCRWPRGVYFIRCGATTQKLIKN